MSLLNVFRPKWQNSDPQVRLKALQELGPENQDAFETVATSDSDPDVRIMAIRKLTNISTLRQVTKEDLDASVKRIAENKLYEEIAKELKDFREAATELELGYVDEIVNTKFAEDLLKTMLSSELRLALVKKCNKPGFLSAVALKDSKEEIALTAVNAIESESLLQDIGNNSRHNNVRQKAIEKLKTLKSDSDTGPSPTMLLFRKREALIQQAKRFIEEKSCLDFCKDFSALIEEANSLGMGPAQAEMDSLHKTFKAKCFEASTKKEAEIKLEKERETKAVELEKVIEEFECYLNENKAEENQKRINEIIDFWTANKKNATTPLLKKFSTVISRFDRMSLSRKAPEKQDNLNDEAVQSMRLEIVEQLNLLSEKEFSETVYSQVRSLTRNWDSLPEKANDDPTVEAYLAIKKTIDEAFEKTNALQEAFIQTNLAKLQELISRIKAIDETQNFRDIAKVLRETYQEWKNIVGDDKYRYQEIWKDYKEATSRFQEMQEWESWHNERDREGILEEMELLAKEEPSKDVLFKLRTLSNQWKGTGPVSPARMNDLRDQFRDLFEKIMENCSPLLEEQNAERQNNFERKEAICDRAEALLKDDGNEALSWKDKFKEFVALQNEWKAIGQVPKEKNQPLWDRFHAVTDAFYSEHKEKIKQEDRSRQSNYEKKILLCEEAESLQLSENWNETSNRLKRLQEEWKATGSVPKAVSDEIWARFRTACDKFFEQKRAHFEELDENKQENLKAKEALCERLETLELDFSKPETMTTLREIQTEWKTIGMVPKETIETIWERYSLTVNKILESYANTNEEIRARLDDIKVQKQAMIDRVSSLMENAGSNQSADATREIQQEWKKLGSCGVDDLELHKQFRAVCDDFFNRRRDQLDIQEQARTNNLQKKIMLCEQAEMLLENLNEETRGDAMNKVKHLRRLWKEVGAVPREHSDKVWKRFNKACDTVFGKTDAPKTDAPKTDAPKTDAPNVEAPIAETPNDIPMEP